MAEEELEIDDDDYPEDYDDDDWDDYDPADWEPGNGPVTQEEAFDIAYKMLGRLSSVEDCMECGLNNYGWVRSDGYTLECPAEPCYAGVSDYNLKDTLAFVDYCGQHSVDDEGYVTDYVRHVLNKSPYSPCIYTKDVDDWYERGTIFRTNFPTKLIIQAANTLRYPYEMPELVRNWAELVELGMDKDAALVFMHFAYVQPGKIDLREHGGGGHAWFGNSEFRVHHLKNFLAGDFSDCLKRDGPMTCSAWESTEYSLMLARSYDVDTARGPRLYDVCPFFENRMEKVVWGGTIRISGIPNDKVPMIIPEMKERGLI